VFRSRGESGDEPIRRAVFEFVVIVTGVLVALAADEWRQERQELRELNGYVVSVLDEVRDNLGTIQVIKSALTTRKLAGLETVIAQLESGDTTVDDPEGFIRQIAYSADTATPWFTYSRFEALKTSGLLRLLEDDDLADSLSSTFQAPQVLLDQVKLLQGDYPIVVNEAIPASYQAELNPLRGYSREAAPEIAIDIGAKEAVDLIHQDRERLLRLARGEAALATAKWYALNRLAEQFFGLERQLAERLGTSRDRPCYGTSQSSSTFDGAALDDVLGKALVSRSDLPGHCVGIDMKILVLQGGEDRLGHQRRRLGNLGNSCRIRHIRGDGAGMDAQHAGTLGLKLLPEPQRDRVGRSLGSAVGGKVGDAHHGGHRVELHQYAAAVGLQDGRKNLGHADQAEDVDPHLVFQRAYCVFVQGRGPGQDAGVADHDLRVRCDPCGIRNGTRILQVESQRDDLFSVLLHQRRCALLVAHGCIDTGNAMVDETLGQGSTDAAVGTGDQHHLVPDVVSQCDSPLKSGLDPTTHTFRKIRPSRCHGAVA